jgi:nucleolar complex protein 2
MQNHGWNKMQIFVKSFVGNILHLLHHTTHNLVLRMVLKSIEPYIIYVATFPKMGKNFMKILLHLWEMSEEHVRVLAFLLIHKLATTASDPMLEYALKGVYLAYVRNCKFVTNKNLPMIQFMSNCVVEIYGLDLIMSYQYAFVYIRQLAIHLRNAMTQQNKVI